MAPMPSMRMVNFVRIFMDDQGAGTRDHRIGARDQSACSVSAVLATAYSESIARTADPTAEPADW